MHTKSKKKMSKKKEEFHNNIPRGFNNDGSGGFDIVQGHGGFGKGGRGPIILYNCNKLRHLARDYSNPCVKCMYCRELDHAMDDFPQLIEKW
jgi:hypothetical protein